MIQDNRPACWPAQFHPQPLPLLYCPDPTLAEQPLFEQARRGDAVAQGIDDVATRNSAQGLRVVDTRAGLLRAGDLLEQAALDKYGFTRDAYLARRQSQVDAARGDDD